VLPLYFASGAGKLGRHSVGTAIVGGMLFSTVLNLIFIPVLYVILKTWLMAGKLRAVQRTDKELAA
jgi:HAE1 family hydrophobic/amphiphilic exporter-1